MIKAFIIRDKLEPKAPRRLRQKADIFIPRKIFAATRISVRPLARLPARPRLGLLTCAGQQLICAIGSAGIGVKTREGDGVTPQGKFAILGWLARFDRRGVMRSGRDPIAKNLGWCDAPASPAYNRPVALPFAASFETMWRDDGLYDLVGVIDYNLRRRAKGRGSAIFLHIARESFEPTAGCVALRRDALGKFAARLSPKAHIAIGDVRAPKIADPTRT